jgi:hypothetical protein
MVKREGFLQLRVAGEVEVGREESDLVPFVVLWQTRRWMIDAFILAHRHLRCKGRWGEGAYEPDQSFRRQSKEASVGGNVLQRSFPSARVSGKKPPFVVDPQKQKPTPQGSHQIVC